MSGKHCDWYERIGEGTKAAINVNMCWSFNSHHPSAESLLKHRVKKQIELNY